MKEPMKFYALFKVWDAESSMGLVAVSNELHKLSSIIPWNTKTVHSSSLRGIDGWLLRESTDEGVFPRYFIYEVPGVV